MFLKIKAFPGSKKEYIEKVKNDRFKVFIRAQARDNQANLSILELLKETFPSSKGIKLISGATKPNKVFEIIEPDNTLL